MNSNSRETLTLLADQLQTIVNKTLGPDSIYVLVVKNGLPPDVNCNMISNAPVHTAHQFKDIFAELSSRNVQLSH